MSTVFTSETRKPEAELDQFSPESILAQRSVSAQREQARRESPQAMIGNASVASAEAAPAPHAPLAPGSEVRSLQSTYGNAVVARIAELHEPARNRVEPAPGETLPAYKPTETKPTGTKPAETKPAAEAKPAVVEAAATQKTFGVKEPEVKAKPELPANETAAKAPAEPARPGGPLPEETGVTKAEKAAGPTMGAKAPEKEEKKEAERKPAKGGEGAGAAEAEAAATGAGGEKGAAAEPEAVEIAPGDPGAMLYSLGAAAPSQAALGLQALRDASRQEFTQQHQELAENPPSMPRPSGLPRKAAAEKPEEAGAGGEEEKPEKVEAKAGEQTQIEVVTPPVKEPLPVPSWMARALEGVPEEDKDFESVAWGCLTGMPTSDENVDTSAGPRPTVDLNDDADPAEMSKQVTTNRPKFDANLIKASEESARDYGENDIFPVVPEEILSANIKAKKGLRSKGKAATPKGIPAEGFAAFDQAAATQWSAAMADARAQNADAADERAAGESSANAKAEKEIASLKGTAIGEQTAAQLQAQADVSLARKGWSDEVTAADGVYTKEAGALETQARKDIDKEKTTADEGARKELEDAEKKASDEKKASEEKAAKKRAEGKKESGGFFGWLKSKAKALINAIRDAVNFIFDQLRKFVKWVIDKAKKAAMWLIEKARQAIVGLIHAFGKALEFAANIFLFAFPKARDKFVSWIHTGVDAAEDAVNFAADKLKEGVAAALDALGAALDFVLELYQKAYNAIIDAVEFIVIGLIEILEGIARLAEAASMVGDFFLGQVQEEGLGIDLTQPLPIEKVTKPGDAPTEVDTAVASGAVSPTDAAVLKKPTLEESDVAMSHVAELTLEPELLASIPPLGEGEEFHFGNNDKPENERDAVLNEARASFVPGAGVNAMSPTTEGGNGTAPTPAAGAPDVANMTPEQQLVYLENQETPHTCDAKKEEEPAKNDAVPDHMRIYGSFTSSQRFSYMWGQIKKGISQWWSCNKVKIIVAFAIGALITLLLAVLTGGAIFAAIPPLLTIIAAILVGVAIVRAASYIGDFIKLGWGGDLQGGAKALARAFAILVIELVFALLFNLGSIIKVIKSGLKATVKAGVGAAKNVIKSTAKAGRELAAATKTAVKAGVANSKLIIQGFKNGFGEGIKTIGELTKQLLAKSRFRGFFFRMRGSFIELWGRFNPAVMLGKRKITKKEAEKSLKDIAKAGEKLSDAARKEAEAIAKAVGEAVETGTGKLSKALKTRVTKFFARFKGHRLDKNPILAEVWERALKRIADGESEFAKYFQNGVLKPNLSDDVMKRLYAKTRGEMNKALNEVVEQLEKDFGKKLANKITELPERVQVHHLIYKSYEAQLAVTKANLILALRKTGGSVDELHDLFHLMSSGGKGNRWKMLQDEISDLIKEIYKL